MTDILGWKPVAAIADDVRSGRVKSIDLVEQCFKRIAETTDYQAIITTLDEPARARAAHIDQQIADGVNPGRLAGVPFIAKDNFLVFGSDTTAASNILRGFKAPYQSTAINRLEAEGAICIAKANMDAFGHGSSTENSDFFVTKNPRDPSRVPGGSSGGPATATVLGMAPFTLGTDTGGSIRQPASYTGCVGLRPTYGVTSRSGVIAMASSTDTIGPITRTVEDAALIFDVYAGQDELDSTTIPRNLLGYTDLNGTVSGKKVGVITEWMGEGLTPEVRAQIEQSISALQAAGAEISSVSLPSLPLALAAYYIIIPAEISSNLSRYDGQRYGYRNDEAHNLTDSYSKSRSIGFGKEAKRRIMIGTYVLSSGYYDAYYRKAQTVRTKLINEFHAALENVDFLIGPVAPSTAFKIGENSADPLQMYLIDMMTVAPALAGVPAISIPAGIGQESHMPVGLQIIARQRNDRELLEFAVGAESAMHKLNNPQENK